MTETALHYQYSPYLCDCNLLMVCLHRDEATFITKKELHRLNNFARQQGFTFLDNPKTCPRCKQPLDFEKDQYGQQPERLENPTPSDLMARFKAKANIISSYMKMTKEIQGMTRQSAVQTEVIGRSPPPAVIASDPQVRKRVLEAVAAIAEFRDQLAAFSDQLAHITQGDETQE